MDNQNGDGDTKIAAPNSENMDQEEATLQGQFCEFARLFDTNRQGDTISLYRSDYWMRQSNVINDKTVTMTDTGICFFKYSKTELNFNEWYEVLTDLCNMKQLNQEDVIQLMTNCGLPGESPVEIPQYRAFFKTYKPKNALIY